MDSAAEAPGLCALDLSLEIVARRYVINRCRDLRLLLTTFISRLDGAAPALFTAVKAVKLPLVNAASMFLRAVVPPQLPHQLSQQKFQLMQLVEERAV